MVTIDPEIGMFRWSQPGVRSIEMGAIRAEAWTMMLGSIASRAARPARATAPLAYVAALLLALLAAASPGAAPVMAQTPAFECPDATTITWNRDAGSDFWINPSNWDLDRVPAAGDHVCLPDLSGTTIVYNGLTTTIASLSSDENLTISGGSLSLAGDLLSRKDLTLTNGTFTVAGLESTIGGKVTLSGGTLNHAATLGVSGKFTWSGGFKEGNGTLLARGGLSLDGGGQKELRAGTVTNAGAGTLGAGTVFIHRGATLLNAAGATLEITANQGLFPLGSGTAEATFRNEGTLVKKAGATVGTTSVSVRFDNAGTVVINSGAGTLNAGRLILSGGGSSAGDFTVETGATLELTGTTQTLNGGLLGTGEVISRSTVTFTKALTFPGVLTISSGTTTLGAASTIGKELRLSGGTLNLAAALAVPGEFIWSGGAKAGAGALTAGQATSGGLTLDGGGQKELVAGTVTNGGSGTLGAGTVFIHRGATLLNAAGATLEVTADQALFPLGNAAAEAAFRNEGRLVKEAVVKVPNVPAGTTTVLVRFDNAGTVVIDAGTDTLNAGRLTLNGGGSSVPTGTGTKSAPIHSFAVAEGATLQFGGIHTLDGGLVDTGNVVSGAGNVVFSSGRADVNGMFDVDGTVTVSGGTVIFAKALDLLRCGHGREWDRHPRRRLDVR